MIKVTAKGNTKQFEPGMTVNEILNAFDVQYLRFACAVEMNGKIVGMDEKVVSDCELKPLTFNDLSKRNMTADQIDDRLVSDNQPYSGLSDGEEVSGQMDPLDDAAFDIHIRRHQPGREFFMPADLIIRPVSIVPFPGSVLPLPQAPDRRIVRL